MMTATATSAAKRPQRGPKGDPGAKSRPKTASLNIKKLAHDLEREVRSREKVLSLPEQHLEIGTRHLMWMCRQVYMGWVPEELAPIWVGYVQGVLRVGGGPNVKEMAAMIREARQDGEARRAQAAGTAGESRD